MKTILPVPDQVEAFHGWIGRTADRAFIEHTQPAAGREFSTERASRPHPSSGDIAG